MVMEQQAGAKAEVKMTEEKLERYIGLKLEIKQLEEYLKDGAPHLAGTVKTAAVFPFALRDIPVGGTDSELMEQFRRQLEIDKAMKKEIEDFIAAVPDEQLRAAFRDRYMPLQSTKHMSWLAVALRNGWRDERTPQIKIQNYLSQCG